MNLNIYTYQECEGDTKILKQLCGIKQAKCVYLKYSSDHNDAIVNTSKEGLVSDYLFTEQAKQVNQQNPMGTPDEASSSSLVIQSDQLKQSSQDVIDVDECDDSRNKSISPDNISTGQCGYKKKQKLLKFHMIQIPK